MVIALVLVLAEAWLVLLWLLGVPTLVKGRLVLVVLGIPRAPSLGGRRATSGPQLTA